ncbi:hypothetical protein [Singulisphaera acidiphila]|uniref:Uncharacterized protein n=1 Tax=Singulisphaera acidiphila (strain ATCC BAA-1392 / DSM 18658 / VKM B-2454 / MOB10) TaxID=886293 RepID=L0D874_SINAD|nr:hypothetical protein [Singulisphaera acidiphila]AGA25609.1 hypothetical protein Sinac_1220 [Singulisphaera acidiphila DSM 18658]
MKFKRFPGLPITLEEPANEKGPWFLFVDRKDGRLPLSIEWRPDQGFGVTTPGPEDFGTGADEIYVSMREATNRAITLIESGGQEASRVT